MTRDEELLVVTEAEVLAALDTFNGGLVRQDDERNVRGYTTFYHPKDSMRMVLENFARHRTRHEDALKEALREARDYVHDTARGYLVNGQCDSNILRGQASEILTRIDSLLADKGEG